MSCLYVAIAWTACLIGSGEAASERTLWVDAKAPAAGGDGSSGKPFKTIGAAVTIARPGDTVVLRKGTYRERVRIPAGAPGKPVTIRAAEGERVVVTACERIGGWKSAGGGLWTTAVDWQPDRLFVDLNPQPMAREPNEGWWRSVKASDGAITDPAHLKGVSSDGPLGRTYVWFQQGNVFGTLKVRALDKEAGRIDLEGFSGGRKLKDGDKYYLKNRRAYIDRPGEWAVEPEGERFRLTFMPHEEGDLSRVEAPRLEGSLINARNVNHFRLEGVEVFGSRRMGVELHGIQDAQVRNCVVHHSGNLGISLREASASSVARCVVRRNGHGISVSYSKGVTVEENDVGYNGVDGILVTWKSDDVTVRRNCVHHHLLWGHPDNMQVYRGVTNVRFQDNLLLAAGQSLMMEETRDGEFTGNMVVGSGAVMLIFGHSNAGHYRVHGNTLAMAGYGCMSLTWEGYDVRENVFMSGHGSALYGVRGVRGYTADRNLFFNSRLSANPTIMTTKAGWLRDFDRVKASSGQDGNSIYADPRFRNAPVGYRVLDSKRLQECTRDRWALRGGSEGWKTGDHVEVNFDGVRRRITGVDGAFITVAPGLREKPIKGWLVANWKEQSDFRLDLRLADNSPGRSLSTGGGPVGSKIDIQAYLAGDFDGDGKRDLPEVPRGLTRY